MGKHELSKQEALDKAQAYCARSEHCASDVRRKLREWAVDPSLYDFIEEKLYEDNYLNDVRFCKAYVHDKTAYQRWGRLKTQAGLQALQLPIAAIQEAMEHIDEETYHANLRYLSEQHRSDSRDKRLRFLLQRGFTYDELKIDSFE